MKLLSSIFVFLFLFKYSIPTSSYCKLCDHYYGLKYFNNKICLKEHIIAIESEMTCFHNELNFTMGTNEPLFKNDGEAPARLINLKPYCIDKTEVSNLQFLLFQIETGYKTQVYLHTKKN